ncbi:hypothetical protein Bra471DRAFT_00244 [Bradyrhizobium sp. WSM471]|nr:hypothetical protein Bra471DRAFT_00244 [Bradyrhizobium sp. WSM471]
MPRYRPVSEAMAAAYPYQRERIDPDLSAHPLLSCYVSGRRNWVMETFHVKHLGTTCPVSRETEEVEQRLVLQ